MPQLWFINPIKVETEIICSVRMVDSQIELDFQRVTLVKINLPAIVRQSLTSRLNDLIATSSLDVAIADIQLQRGAATVSGLRVSRER